MDVAILVKEFPPDVVGGTEIQTLNMARKLQSETDLNVTVYTKAYPDQGSPDSDFEIVRVPNWSVTPFMSTLTFVLVALYYLFRDRSRIDILQCMMIYPNGFVGYMLNKVSRIRYFAWIRGGDFYFMKENPVKRLMIDRVIRDSLVLTQSCKIRDDVRSEFSDGDIEVLGNGVEIPPSPARGDQVLYVGRLKAQKGVDVLLNAMAGLGEELVVIGDGPERVSLEAQAESLELNAEFTGSIPHHRVGDYLKNGKVFVLPAVRGEGLPNAILEAMAHGLPVVSTEIAGIPDIVEDGETGFTVPPGDPGQLREQIKRLCGNPSLSQELGSNGREYVRKNHSWEVIIDRLTKIYEKVQRTYR